MLTYILEPGLLDELARRVEEAEKKFQAADLDLRLKELDAAKQRQVKLIKQKNVNVKTFIFNECESEYGTSNFFL